MIDLIDFHAKIAINERKAPELVLRIARIYPKEKIKHFFCKLLKLCRIVGE